MKRKDIKKGKRKREERRWCPSSCCSPATTEEIGPRLHMCYMKTQHNTTHVNRHTFVYSLIYYLEHDFYNLFFFWNTTGFTRLPMPWIKISQTSLCCNHTWGLRLTPTPWGVPVIITSPGFNVVPCDKKLTSVATSKTTIQSCFNPSAHIIIIIPLLLSHDIYILTHITSIVMLQYLSIDFGTQCQVVWILDQFRWYNHGPKRIKCIKSLSKTPLTTT